VITVFRRKRTLGRTPGPWLFYYSDRPEQLQARRIDWLTWEEFWINSPQGSEKRLCPLEDLAENVLLGGLAIAVIAAVISTLFKAFLGI
jgi:hypothetical protein